MFLWLLSKVTIGCVRTTTTVKIVHAQMVIIVLFNTVSVLILHDCRVSAMLHYNLLYAFFKAHCPRVDILLLYYSNEIKRVFPEHDRQKNLCTQVRLNERKVDYRKQI